MIKEHALANFGGTARLFPLPNLVFFPQVHQGLHIFEPRYRQLMVDTLETDRLFALVLLKPNWEDDYDARPAIESVACLGRVAWHETLVDGRYNLRLLGLSRVRIVEELATDRMYRSARVELLTEAAPHPAQGALLRNELADLVLPRFDDDAQARKQLQELFEGNLTLGQLCDILAYVLPLPLQLKQLLLSELDATRRVITLTEALRTSGSQGDRKFPPPFSPN